MGDELTNTRIELNLGQLSRPATKLIEKISDAIGGIFKPYQIRRVAQAEAEAEIIKVQSQIEVTGLQHRALQRFFAEEAMKQCNIESITTKALPEVKSDAKPENVEDDWISNFFDKCRLISDNEMQTLWAKVLAGEANSPGRFSKRTVNFLTTLDKKDAELFDALCGFGWCYEPNKISVLIYRPEYNINYDPIYLNKGIRFDTLKHLSEIGLLTHDSSSGFILESPPSFFVYYGTVVVINSCDGKGIHRGAMDMGHVLLSKVGEELATVCNSKPVDGFFDYVLRYWAQHRVVFSSPYPRIDLSAEESNRSSV